ncbi:Dihydrofolate reductase [compost metagenome]
MVSRQSDLQLAGAEVFASLPAAIARADEWAREQGVVELMLIGGAELYGQGLALAQRLYLTRVHLQPEGDAWFPEFAESDWRLVSRDEQLATAETPAHAYEVWARD